MKPLYTLQNRLVYIMNNIPVSTREISGLYMIVTNNTIHEISHERFITVMDCISGRRTRVEEMDLIQVRK